MGKYKVFIDVSDTWEDGDIELITLDVEGEDSEEVRNKVLEGIVNGEYGDKIGNRETYVWEVVEEDRLLDEEDALMWGKLGD